MRSEDLEEALRNYKMQVFTINDAAKLTGKPNKYVSLFLSKNKRFTKIIRGRYCIRNASIYAIASGILAPSYISGISALRYYNLITQMPNTIEVISARQHKPIEIQGYMVKFIKFSREHIFGYRKEDGAMIADPEKAIIDSLYMRLDYSYVSEAMGSYLSSIDDKKLIRYAIEMDSKATVSRLGFSWIVLASIQADS
jgi:Predicted transcriptional regulator